MTTAQRITDATRADGGVTWIRYGVSFLDVVTVPAGPLAPGVPVYVVGRAGNVPAITVPLADFAPADVDRMLTMTNGAGPQGEAVDGVGTWVDDGTVYVDAVDLWTSRDAAILTARMRGELAVWDNGAGQAIDVDDPCQRCGGDHDRIDPVTTPCPEEE